MSFDPAVAYHFCLALPAAFTQPGAHPLAEPCTPVLTVTHLEDDLLDAELDLLLGVHDRVGGVQQDLLHVRQSPDLLRQVPE